MSGFFRRNGPVYLESGGYTRKRKRKFPRWLLLMLAGGALGAGAVLYAQSIGPRQLTLEESRVLQDKAGALERENALLRADVEGKARQVQALHDEGARLASESKAARDAAEILRKDLALIDQVLPPDPRNSAIAVRAARFTADGSGNLGYQALLTRDKSARKPLQGIVEVIVVGHRPNGREESIGPASAVMSFEGAYLTVRGSLPLPEGFTPQQATLRVLDGEGGRTLGMRTFNVR